MAQHILISAISLVFCDRLLAGRGVGVGGLGRLCRLYVRVGHDAAVVNVVVCVFFVTNLRLAETTGYMAC